MNPRAITGVATDVAGAVGVTEHGPATPTLITGWAEFQTLFGGFIDDPRFATPYWRLPYAVRGFFENGGRQLYVARVLDPSAPAGDGDLAAFVGGTDRLSVATGLAALMGIPGLTLMAMPDAVVAPAFADALLDRCETARNRVAIVDGPSGATDPATVSRRRDTAFSALYYPWLRVPAPHRPEGHVVVPPCGHVAGCLARAAVASATRVGEAAPELNGLTSGEPGSADAPLDRLVSSRDSERLAPEGVNVIRDFRAGGRGVRVWGVRTMSSDPDWKYVHMRRLFLFLEQSIDQGTQWVAFEPNSQPTWAAVRASVETFLTDRWRAGAFVGATTREAFFVKCDRSTMTQADLDNGRLVCEVGVAPLRPAEFVIFRIGQWTRDRP